MKHWLYLYPANLLGVLLGWALVIYVGETNNPRRRRAQHMDDSWWRWMAWRSPIVIPIPGRWAAMHVEERIVRTLRTPGNKEYNRGGLRPLTVLARLAALIAVGVLVWQLGLAPVILGWLLDLVPLALGLITGWL